MAVVANVQNALEQLWSHKLRSLLTVLGIVIAVTSTITVVGVIQGFTGYVSEFLQGLGTNAMWVWPQRPAGEAGKRLRGRGGQAARAGRAGRARPGGDRGRLLGPAAGLGAGAAARGHAPARPRGA